MKTNPTQSTVAQWTGILIFLLFLSRVGVQAQTPANYYIMDSWSFLYTNGVDFGADDFGYPPTALTNVAILPGPDGNSLLVGTNKTAYYNFPVIVDGDGTNLMVQEGTVLFWFAPTSWGSTNGGAGPGDEGRFIDVGAQNTNSPTGWWSIHTDVGGTHIYFEGQTNGNGATYLRYPIAWASNTWVSVAITYSATNSILYLNGVPVTNGLGVSYYPGTNVLASGMWFGSDSAGSNQIHGLISGVETLNTPVDSNTIASLVEQPSMGYEAGNYFNLLSSAPANLPGSPVVYDAFNGPGILQQVGTASSCSDGTNDYNVWITNVVATKVMSGTNLTMNLKFTVEGGSNGIPSNVFANTAIGTGTNYGPWAWLGQVYQCNTYLLTNLPGSGCFLRLETSQDSLGIGIPDWWELQFFGHIGVNPYADPTGDGWTLLQDYESGFNPLVFTNPPPPQNVQATLDSTGTNIIVTWASGGGPVQGYTVQYFFDSYSEPSPKLKSLMDSFQFPKEYRSCSENTI